MNALVFQAPELQALRSRLLSHAPREAAALLFAGIASTPSDTRLLIRETLFAENAAYQVQEADRLELKPEFLAPAIKRARTEGWGLVIAHTHPFDRQVRFSAADDAGERMLRPSVCARATGKPHASLVPGQGGFDTRLWLGPDVTQPVELLREVGRELLSEQRGAQQAAQVDPQYDRSLRAFGRAGQRLVQQLTVGIVGLGGVGSIVAQELAYLGVRRFILVDPDAVEPTNLNRLLGASRPDVGRKKVDVIGDGIKRVFPDASATAVTESVLTVAGGRPLLDTDMIFCCTDSQGSRAVLNQLAYQYYIPTIDVGVRIDAKAGKVTNITGRVQMLAPGLPCLVCQGLLDPKQVRADLMNDDERRDDPYIVGAAEPQPAVISINGTMASAAVTMMLSAVAGLPSPARHQVYLGERGIMRSVEGRRDPVCIACSLRGSLGRGDLWSMTWRGG